MSFTLTTAAWLAVGVTAASAIDNRETQKRAGKQAKANALVTARLADEANNRANRKSPDTAAAMAAAMLSGKAGNSSTSLTGPQGIDPSLLTLGRNSLLGGGPGG